MSGTDCGKVVLGKEGFGTTTSLDCHEALFQKVGFTFFEMFGKDAKG